MGLQQSKDELLYEQVVSGNVEGIKSLRSEGAGLEWTDREGKTPLVASCVNPELYHVAETLIELGANVNAYRSGRNAGTPLHHAARRGLHQTVNLLLSHGANPLLMNDDCQTPLDVARTNGYSYVVRAIEDRISLFSGWLLEFYGPGFLNLLVPQLLSRKSWVVILPCGALNPQKALKLELAIYNSFQDAQPRTIVPLWKCNLEEPNFNQPDPAAIISVLSRIPRRWRRRRALRRSQEARQTRIRLGPLSEAEKEQLMRFCSACKGIPQVIHPSFPLQHQVLTAPATLQAENQPPVDASVHSITNERPPSRDSSASSYSTDSSADAENHSVPHDLKTKSAFEEAGPSTTLDPNQDAVPSAPPTIDDGPIQYPSIDTSHIDMSPLSVEEIPSHPSEKKEDGAAASSSSSSSSCTICLDAPVECACVPCGHMVGCLSCLNEIKEKNWGCPVCRAKIDQIIRIYAV